MKALLKLAFQDLFGVLKEAVIVTGLARHPNLLREYREGKAAESDARGPEDESLG